MEEKQVFVSFKKPLYKENKSDLLMCKTNIIVLQKSLVNLHAIRSNKKRLLNLLFKLAQSTEITAKKLDNKIPDSSIPKELKIKQLKKELTKKKAIQKKEIISSVEKKNNLPIINKDDLEMSYLDKELLELNQRIKELD